MNCSCARGLSNEKKYAGQLGPHEWWLPKLAEAIPVSAGKLADWARRGWLHSRRTPAQHLWILWADDQEVKRLRKLAALSHRGIVEYPAGTHDAKGTALTTPPLIRTQEVEDQRLLKMEAPCLLLPSTSQRAEVRGPGGRIGLVFRPVRSVR